MSWKGILRRGGVNLTGPDGSNDWNFEGIVNARNIVSRFAGSHFHVDSNHANASDGSGYGKRKDKPFATIDYTVGQCAANNADVIWVHAGHVEAVIGADGLDLDVEGITIVFLGNGDDQAKITFGTDVGADMVVDADNVTMINPRFEAAIDALTGPININKPNFTLINGEYYDAAAKATTDCLIAIAAAKGLTIDGWKYYESTTGTQKQSNIQLNGVDDLVLRNIDIRGDFATGNLENVTDELLNTRFDTIYLDNLNSGPIPCMVLDDNCDGFAVNVNCRVASGTTYLSDNSDINWGADCIGFSADGGSGEPLGTSLAGGLEGKVDIIDEYHDVPAQNNVLNAQINEVLGNKTDTGAAGAVTETDTLVGYIKQLVTAAIADAAAMVIVDEFHDVPAKDNTLNAQINEVLGNKEDTTAAGAVTETDTLVGYIKQLVAGGIARDTAMGTIDGLHDVPVKDAATNLYLRDVVGIKTDTAAAGAVSEVESVMAYVKQAVTLAIARDTAIGVVDGLHDVPTADAVTNLYVRDVVGIKTDAAINAVATTKTLMAYLKGVLNEITVPAQNNTDNAFINDVIGQKTDTTAAGVVTETDTLTGYIKQLVAAAIADAAQTLKLDGVTISTTPVAASLASFVASGGTTLGKQLPVSTSLVDLLGDFTGPHDGAVVDDNVKASLDLLHTHADATPQCVEKSDGAVLAGLDPIFTISGGPVRAKIVGLVTGAAIGGAANGRLQHITTEPAATVELNLGAVAIDTDPAGTFYYNIGATSVFTPSGGLGFNLQDPVTVEETEFILAPGVVQFLSDGAQTGNIKWYMSYKPLSPSSVVTAAA